MNITEAITYTAEAAKSAEATLAHLTAAATPARQPLRPPLLARALNWLATSPFPRLRAARAALLSERTRRIAAEQSADCWQRDAEILRGICEDLRKRAQEAEDKHATAMRAAHALAAAEREAEACRDRYADRLADAERYIEKTGGKHAWAFYRADWSKRDCTLAREIGCTQGAVHRARKRLGHAPVGRGGQRGPGLPKTQEKST